MIIKYSIIENKEYKDGIKKRNKINKKSKKISMER